MDRRLKKAVPRPTRLVVGLSSIPGLSIWYLWRKKWPWDSILPQYFGSPLPLFTKTPKNGFQFISCTWILSHKLCTACICLILVLLSRKSKCQVTEHTQNTFYPVTTNYSAQQSGCLRSYQLKVKILTESWQWSLNVWSLKYVVVEAR